MSSHEDATRYAPTTEFLTTDTSDAVLTISLNRPNAMNAFRPEMLEGIASLVNRAAEDDEIAVIVLQGEGRAFSAGVDLKVLQGIEPANGKIGDLFDEPARQACLAIRSASRPVIAKVHGACFTGALEIALHCDFVFTTADTKFGDTHAKFGLRPTWGMSQTLAQAVGVRRAKELSFTARIFSGDEAVRYGIANEAVADKAELDRLVAERAAQIADNSRAAVAAMKDLYALAQQRQPLEAALREELAREYPDIRDSVERLSRF
jgi:enoyl-CoA hydratase/carnithine racemase